MVCLGCCVELSTVLLRVMGSQYSTVRTRIQRVEDPYGKLDDSLEVTYTDVLKSRPSSYNCIS
jgi:hypothetical protein